MLRIEAPFPLMQSTLVLPSPRQGNSRKLAASTQTMRSRNGKVYTYIKPKRGRRIHEWGFLVARDKYLEAKEFVELYASKLVRVIDHEDVVRLMWLIFNPLEFDGDGRAFPWPGEEAYAFQLQAEEKV